MSQDSKSSRSTDDENLEITAMLYRSAQIPTLLMVLCSAVCVWVLRDSAHFAALSVWAVAVVGLAVLRFLSVYLLCYSSSDIMFVKM